MLAHIKMIELRNLAFRHSFDPRRDHIFWDPLKIAAYYIYVGVVRKRRTKEDKNDPILKFGIFSTRCSWSIEAGCSTWLGRGRLLWMKRQSLVPEHSSPVIEEVQ